MCKTAEKQFLIANFILRHVFHCKNDILGTRGAPIFFLFVEIFPQPFFLFLAGLIPGDGQEDDRVIPVMKQWFLWFRSLECQTKLVRNVIVIF